MNWHKLPLRSDLDLRGGFGVTLELLGLIVRNKRVDQFADVTFHEQVQLVRRVAYAMIRDAIVLEVVGANLLRAIARADAMFTPRPVPAMTSWF